MLSYKRVHLRLLLEDVEVSISSINVNTATDSSAQITILPHKDMLHIKPGTNVSVFFKDIKAEPAITIDLTTIESQGVLSEKDQAFTTSYKDYSLLFMGHVEHFNMNRQATARSGILQCKGDLNLLKRFQTYISNVNKDILNRTKNFIGASAFFSNTTGEHELARQITERFTTDEHAIHTPGFTGLRGPAKGFISTIEHSMGVIDNDGTRGKKKRGAQQDFFAVSNYQSKLLYQIGAVDVDDSVNSLLKTDQTKVLLDKSVNTSTGIMDLLTLLRKIMGKLYYKVYGVTTSRIVEADTKVSPGDDALEEAKKAIPTDEIDKLIELVQVMQKRLSKRVPNAVVSADALVSALRRDGIFSEVFNTTISSIGDFLIVDEIGSKKLINTIENAVEPFSSQLYDSLRVIFSDIQNNIIEPQKNVGLEKLLEIKSSLLGARMQLASSISSKANTFSVDRHFRVLNYLLLPEMFFATPPTCNIIFPNQISSFSYSADAFNKPSRLMLYTQKGVTGENKVGPNSVNTTAYFAPSSELFINFQKETTLKKSLPLLKHEHHTGIVPIIREISALESNRLKSSSGNLDRDTIYLKLANFQLLQERFKDDTIQVTGPFNPFACPGFTCAVIDTDHSNHHHEPTVYLGLLQSVSHSISTNNASTNYSISYARTFEEVDELFEDSTLNTNSSHSPAPLHITKSTVKNTLLVGANTSYLDSLRSYLYTTLIRKIPEDTLSGIYFFIYSTQKLINVRENTVNIDAGNNIPVSSVPILSPWIADNYSRLSEDSSNSEHIKAVANIWQRFYVDNNLGRLLWEVEKNNERLLVVKDNYIKAYAYRLSKSNVPAKDISEEFIKLNQVISSFLTSFNVTVEGWKEFIEKDTTLKYRKKYFNSEQWNLFNFYTPSNPSDVINFIINEQLVNTSSAVVLPKYSTPQGISLDVFAVKDSLISREGVEIAQKAVLAEELYRPSWYGDNFSVLNIGKELYQKLLGSRSVQDYLEGSNLEKDSVVVSKLTGSIDDVYSTKKSILYAVDIYNKLNNSENRVRYVESYVRRPIANMADIVGPFGFITNKESDSVHVEDHSKNCGEGKVNKENEHVRDPVVDPNIVIAEKRHACNNYEVQTRKRVYR